MTPQGLMSDNNSALAPLGTYGSAKFIPDETYCQVAWTERAVIGLDHPMSWKYVRSTVDAYLSIMTEEVWATESSRKEKVPG